MASLASIMQRVNSPRHSELVMSDGTDPLIRGTPPVPTISYTKSSPYLVLVEVED